MLRLLICTLFLSGYICSAQSKTKMGSIPKVEKLISQMTLEEKIGQMTQINITMLMTDSVLNRYDSVMAFRLDTAKLIRYITQFNVGTFLNGRGISKTSWFPYMDQLHRLNMKYSRLKIPILYGIDHVHGSSYIKEGTIFPHNINIAATFDTSHAHEVGAVTVYETSGLGHNWIFSPVADLGKNKFWGRYYETFGEDPLLASRMCRAIVHGIQNSAQITPYKVAACAKHFLGYSDPKSGWDRSPAEIPEQSLREFFLPPFKAAIDAGVKTIMVNSGEVNGIPVHTSYELLTKLLREELGFKGILITDWMDIIALEKMHYVVENEKEATYKAIMAGIDISMVPVSTNFCVYLKELVKEGRITEERINQSVRRILTVKYDLGLFDHSFPDIARLSWIGQEKSKQQALSAARESIVLLKNEKHILPMKVPSKIVVTGATAQSKIALCGGWTYRFAPKSDWWIKVPMPTVFDAIKAQF
ncbi:MAG TPA: glycoside hydrolase family 3 protein, partial [Cytophagales bacterium]|nr:glycoside hydrolase family 3 protein [Cytophagales bacterium]